MTARECGPSSRRQVGQIVFKHWGSLFSGKTMRIVSKHWAGQSNGVVPVRIVSKHWAGPSSGVLPVRIVSKHRDRLFSDRPVGTVTKHWNSSSSERPERTVIKHWDSASSDRPVGTVIKRWGSRICMEAHCKQHSLDHWSYVSCGTQFCSQKN